MICQEYGAQSSVIAQYNYVCANKKVNGGENRDGVMRKIHHGILVPKRSNTKYKTLDRSKRVIGEVKFCIGCKTSV
jgi:hypothetical protein